MKSEDWRLEKSNSVCNRFHTCSWNPLMLLCCVAFSKSWISVNEEITNEDRTPCTKNESNKHCKDQESLEHRRCKHTEKVQTFIYIFAILTQTFLILLIYIQQKNRFYFSIETFCFLSLLTFCKVSFLSLQTETMRIIFSSCRDHFRLSLWFWSAGSLYYY